MGSWVPTPSNPKKTCRLAIEKLLQRGIAVEELTAPLMAEVDVFTVGSFTRAQRAFQNHREMKIRGRVQEGADDLSRGHYHG